MEMVQELLAGFSWDAIIKTGLRLTMILGFAWLAMKLLQKFLQRLEQRLVVKSEAEGSRPRNPRNALKPLSVWSDRRPCLPCG